MVTIALCPDTACAAPAEISHHVTVESTDGPLAMVRAQCANGHRYLLPAEQVPTACPAWPARVPARLFISSSSR